PLYHLERIVDLQVKDLDHIDEAVEPLRLGVTPRESVEHQGMLLGHEQFLHLEDVQVALKYPHREVVGNHQALRSELLDLAAELAGPGYLAEDVAHGDMDEAGKLTENGPLGPLAAAWHAEQENRLVSVTCFHAGTLLAPNCGKRQVTRAPGP